MYVVEEAVAATAATGAMMAVSAQKEAVEGARERLTAIAEKVEEESVGLRVSLHVAVGTPWREIVRLGNDLQADLLVVGTHGREGLDRVLLGSVAQSVVRKATCPVLVVRPKEPRVADVPEIEPPVSRLFDRAAIDPRGRDVVRSPPGAPPGRASLLGGSRAIRHGIDAHSMRCAGRHVACDSGKADHETPHAPRAPWRIPIMRDRFPTLIAVGLGLTLSTLARAAAAQDTPAPSTTSTTTTTTAAPAPVPAPATATTSTSTTSTPDGSSSTTTTTSAAATDVPETPTTATQTTTVKEQVYVPPAASRWPNVPMEVTGFTLFAATYVPAVVVAAESARVGDKNLYYPVAGPWMDMAKRTCTNATCPNETLARVGLAADGVVQGVGALLLVSGLFVPEKVTHALPLWGKANDKQVMVTPSSVGSGYGVGAVGRF